MDKQKKYVTTLFVLLAVTSVILSALAENRLEVYLSLYTVSYFAATALFQPRKRSFDIVGTGLFLIFCYIVALKIWEIIR
jgi:hypothetical protein